MSTYTYTARHADDPRVVVTFTLHDDRLSVDLGAPLEQIERALRPKGEERGLNGLRTWLKPTAVAVLQRSTRPFHVADVYARARREGLRVTSWVRTGGLRLAPIAFVFRRVDNPEAAEGFVRELRRRKAEVPRPGRFPGPLDYWGGWALTAALAMGLLIFWRVRSRRGRRV